MGTSLESVNALKSRALEVALSPDEANASARLAFAACHPGQRPTEAQLQPLLQPIDLNPGNVASLKRLIFEVQTLVCNEVKIKANKKEDAPTNFAPSEREARIQQQKDRLSGLRFRGEEECAHCSNDIALTMLEKDTLVYLGPEKFPTRRNELQLKKPGKEIAIDQSQLIVKEKPADFTCSTNTELEVANAFRRRALAFDLVGICSYNIMTSYRVDLLHHLHTPPPPGYSPITIQQVLRADRAAFIFLSERMTSLKRDATNRIPMDHSLPNILGQPTVAFHLLPLAGAAASPKEKLPGTKICWGFNLPNGCKAAKPGESCSKGFHVCAEPGCFNPILYKATVEKMKVSLLASLLLDGRLAKFCTRDFCGHRSFNG